MDPQHPTRPDAPSPAAPDGPTAIPAGTPTETPSDTPIETRAETLVEAIAPEDGLRLDAFVASLCPTADRVTAGHWVREGRVEVPGKLIKPSMHLRAGDRVRVRVPAPRRAEAEPEDLPLPILYRDDALVVVDKPAGMATHPGPGWWKGSALNALLYHVPDWLPINGVLTPGIVHRLDRDTAGLLIFANGERAHQALLQAMRERRVAREYLALVEGRLEGEGTVDAPLDRDPARPERVIVTPAGQRAVTHWRVLAHAGDRTLVALRLETGRTHQIRVHMAHLGHPVAHDPWYGSAPSPGADGADDPAALALHAYRLTFRHPLTDAPIQVVSRPAWWDGPINF